MVHGSLLVAQCADGESATTLFDCNDLCVFHEQCRLCTRFFPFRGVLVVGFSYFFYSNWYSSINITFTVLVYRVFFFTLYHALCGVGVALVCAFNLPPTPTCGGELSVMRGVTCDGKPSQGRVSREPIGEREHEPEVGA